MTTQDLYKNITDQIIAQLEKGNLQPWKCPWNRTGGVFPLRHNGIPYRGVNVLWLWMTATLKGYSSPYYMTFQQAKEYGGTVRKGERSTPVLFCQPMTKSDTAPDGKEGKESYWIARSYNVFSADQVDGLSDKFNVQAENTLDPSQKIEHAETFFANTKATIDHAGCAAYYQKLSDRIVMPPFETFHSPQGYYSTLAHETHHWAGCPSRLNRFAMVDGTRDDYAKEEITAELAACLTTAQLGFDSISHSDHAAYLDHWLKAMKSDAKYIFQAASKAQASADYLNSLQPSI